MTTSNPNTERALANATKNMVASIKLRVPPLPSLLPLRDFICLFIFFLVFFSQGSESHDGDLENYLLCKYCGADAADLEYAVRVDSPVSLKTVNQTLSGKKVVIQTLKNPAGVYFDVITVKKSNCIGYGEWSKTNTWFPGYAWKICVCQPWGHFLGWLFEPYKIIKRDQKKASDEGFYALITENILTEQFSNSLLIIPKSFAS